MVIRPVKVAGRTAAMAVFFQEEICSVCAVADPAGIAVTLQPLHCVPKLVPAMVMVPPAATTRGDVVNSGPMEKMVVSILQRTAEKKPNATAYEPQSMLPSEALLASKMPVPAIKSS